MANVINIFHVLSFPISINELNLASLNPKRGSLRSVVQ